VSSWLDTDLGERVEPRLRTALAAFETAVESASADRCITLAPADLDCARPVVLGAGKAAAAMAVAFNRATDGRADGLVVTRYGHGLKPGEDAGRIDVLEAGHPAPDSASVAAAKRMLTAAGSLRDGDTLWFLVSGGGSALLAAPLPGVTLAEKRQLASCLMHSGADIREINTVRKHLSAIKGGRLASVAHPARVRTLAISDVPGDSLADIASGPTIPDPTTRDEALATLRRYRCPLSPAVEVLLGSDACETPKPGTEPFAADQASVIASATTALDAAERYLQSAGYRVTRLGDDLAAPARELGAAHAKLALDIAGGGGRYALLSGGETTVVVKNEAARGGRNLEYLASLALALAAAPNVVALAADTDGIDGNGDHAGGLVVPGTLARGRALGLDLDDALAANATYDYFDRCKLLLRTGPTRTNVNDFRLLLIDDATVE
jgi:glycerate 2-kinase